MTVKNVLVLHGPNLNLLGERPGEDRSVTLDGLNHQLQVRADALGLTLRICQSNHEGELIDRLHAERQWADAVVISPEALAHTSYVLREALVAVGKPAIEVHLTDIRRRESWRRKSVLKDVCLGQVLGKGIGSYLAALEQLAGGEVGGKKRGGKKAAGRNLAPASQSAAAESSLGRRTARKAEKAPGRGGEKTLGRGNAEVSSEPEKTVGRGAAAADSQEKSFGRGAAAAGSVEKSFGRGITATGSQEKTLGRGSPAAGAATKTLGRNGAGESARSGGGDAREPAKSLGRGAVAVREVEGSGGRARGTATDFLTRALVRQKISERLSGKLTPGGLAAWARTQWNRVQEGAPAEVGHRDELEDVLQTLTLSTLAASRISDEQLVDLMAQLDR